MHFREAVVSVLSKGNVWRGRARRSEFWYFGLFGLGLFVVAANLDEIWGSPLLAPLTCIVLYLPGLAVTIRRLHDTARSGWWIWIQLVPVVGPLVLLVFLSTAGTPYRNCYGPSWQESTMPADVPARVENRALDRRG